MVLSNTKIRDAIAAGEIFIGVDESNPFPVDKLEFDTTAVDLHLANEFRIWKSPQAGDDRCVDPAAEGFNLAEYGTDYTTEGAVETDGSYIVKQGAFVLCRTLEYVRLNNNFAARIEGRSVLGRLGLAVHITAPNVHAGFRGTLTLEIYNHSPVPVRLRPGRSANDRGLRIAQLVFSRVEGQPTERAQATYTTGQTRALGSGRP